ncbi:GntR family transcriptional regulator [Paracoccus sp. 1_MG-2023]|uniref:GntR family transcriptional regulator n=1 Tax=unclassified Paracoccus (in: a-proteobacteria) TaxID=2688777 RepID=UPI001C091227|nr:GntR family transcriptional regulator [Paracoccus sp. 1_MG-2023]MBU2956910.1 GntR family transcriptional regulator [Paracoccus sp. C2R09]MDO6668108.1 GntR family transcriptional regulator [Paracoccus sp. 1_MG-2023]
MTVGNEGGIRTRARVHSWQSIREHVLERIQSGEWAPGDLIPTEQELAQQMGCARATVNRALRELAGSGIVQRRRKVGTRVAATPMRRMTMRLPVIRDEIEAMQATYAYELTGCERRAPTARAAAALCKGMPEELMMIQSRHLADGQPHCCEAVWLHPELLELPECTHFRMEAPHDWLNRSRAVTQTRFAILTEGASGTCAVNLGVDDGTPLLTIERTSLVDGVAVSFARQFYPPGHRLVFDD